MNEEGRYSGGESIHHMSYEQLLLRDCFPLGKKKIHTLKAFSGPVCFFFYVNSISSFPIENCWEPPVSKKKKKKVASARSWGTLGFKGLALEKTKEKLEYS